jgi:hypothetical protein
MIMPMGGRAGVDRGCLGSCRCAAAGLAFWARSPSLMLASTTRACPSVLKTKCQNAEIPRPRARFDEMPKCRVAAEHVDPKTASKAPVAVQCKSTIRARSPSATLASLHNPAISCASDRKPHFLYRIFSFGKTKLVLAFSLSFLHPETPRSTRRTSPADQERPRPPPNPRLASRGAARLRIGGYASWSG